MNVQSADFLAAGLTPAGVNANADLQPEAMQCQLDRSCATNGRACGIEQREKAVTGRVDFGSSAVAQRSADNRAIAGEQCVPALVAQPHQPLR